MTGLEPFMPWIFFTSTAVVIGGAVAFASYLTRKRRDALAAIAERMGLSFMAADPSLYRQDFMSFHLFHQGHEQTFSNIMRGQPEGTAGVILCDYAYTNWSGTNNRGKHNIHAQTVALLRYPRQPLPQFDLRPENIVHRIGSTFGCQDIDFPASPDFSRSYLLRGPEEAAIRSLFGINLLKFFENHPGWCVEGGGAWLAVYRSGRLVKPKDYPTFIDEAKLVLWAFPPLGRRHRAADLG